MAEAALSMFGGVTTSIDLVKTGIGLCIALRNALNNYKDLKDQAGKLCELYTQVKSDLEKIEASLTTRKSNEGSARTLDSGQDPEQYLFKTLVRSTREEISAANSTVKELNDRVSQARGAKRGSSSRRPWKRLLKFKTIVLEASGVIDISSGLEKV